MHFFAILWYLICSAACLFWLGNLKCSEHYAVLSTLLWVLRWQPKTLWHLDGDVDCASCWFSSFMISLSIILWHSAPFLCWKLHLRKEAPLLSKLLLALWMPEQEDWRRNCVHKHSLALPPTHPSPAVCSQNLKIHHQWELQITAVSF